MYNHSSRFLMLFLLKFYFSSSSSSFFLSNTTFFHAHIVPSYYRSNVPSSMIMDHYIYLKHLTSGWKTIVITVDSSSILFRIKDNLLRLITVSNSLVYTGHERVLRFAKVIWLEKCMILWSQMRWDVYQPHRAYFFFWYTLISSPQADVIVTLTTHKQTKWLLWSPLLSVFLFANLFLPTNQIESFSMNMASGLMGENGCEERWYWP